MKHKDAMPFRQAARDYLANMEIGVPIPIHFPAKDGGKPTKAPLAKDCTGRGGAYPDLAKVKEWERRYPRASVGLRLRREVVGIDVDLYGDKAGFRTISTLQQKWGVLPDTWKTTSRKDGSKIRLYRLPVGTSVLNWRDPKLFDDSGKLASGGVELIRWCHRFVTVYPTVHPTVGKRYHWLDPDDAKFKGVPALGITDLPLLPEGWIAGLETGRDYGDERIPLTTTPWEWLRARPYGDDTEPCEAMRKTLDHWLPQIAYAGENGGAHPTMRDAVWAVIGDVAQGMCGAECAVLELRSAYLGAMSVNRRRGPFVVAGEFDAALVRAIERHRTRVLGTECVCRVARLIDEAGTK